MRRNKRLFKHQRKIVMRTTRTSTLFTQFTRSLFRNLPVVLTLLAAGTLASAQITPSADAYTNSASPTTNFGAGTLLDVDGASQLAFIQFNLASIPSGASVSQATLKLYVNAVTTAGSFNVDYVSSTWAENTITFDLAPALGSSIASNVSVTTAAKNQYLLINVTSAVQAWLDGSQANDGIALVANSTFNASFDSKENAGTSHPAELDVVFASSNPGTITEITTNSGSGLSGGGASGSLNLSLTTSCASGQMLEWIGEWSCSPVGTGTITGATAGAGVVVGHPIAAGGAADNNGLTISLNPSQVPFLASANTFLTTQEFNSSVGLAATTGPNTGVIYIGSTPMLHNYYGSSTSNPNNTFVGGAGNFSLTTANALVGIGYGALSHVTTSSASVAVGNNALAQVTSGSFNSAVGLSAGTSLDDTPMTGSNNTFLGAGAAATTGNLTNATVIGADAVVSQSNSLILGCLTKGCPGSVSVGIGTTTPQQTLDVAGTNWSEGPFQPAVTGIGNAIIRGPQNFGFAGQQAYVYLGDTNHYIEAQNNLGLIFMAYNDPNPLVIWDGSDGVSYAGAITIGGSFLSNPPNSSYGFYIQQGLGRAVADGWDSYSSRRWKTNIRTLRGALNKVERLRGVSYDLKSSGKHEIGVIAEEVGAVVPELVTWEKNGKDASGVDYGRLTALLIETSKTQEKLMRQQQQQIKAQQGQIKAAQAAASIRRTQLGQLASEMKRVQAALKAGDRGTGTELASEPRLPFPDRR
jgi:Chaperone of endosialidase/TGF-beta propeptide